MTVKQNAHKHRWNLSGYSSTEILFACKCGEHKTCKMTPEQKKAFAQAFRDDRKAGRALFKTLHEFRRKTQDGGNKFKYAGYALMKAMDRFAAKHGCHVVTIDDDYSASSTLLFIPHETETQLWGASMVVAPQLCGSPVIMSLSPHNIKSLILVLQDLYKRYKQKEPLHKARERSGRKALQEAAKIRN